MGQGDLASYNNACERLFSRWLTGDLRLSHEAQRMFSLEHAPEPYLPFGDQARPLVILTTNPGGGLDIQRRSPLLSLVGRPADALEPYAACGPALAGWYRRRLGGPAASRISKMIALANAMGYSGVFQVEAIPFHSHSLPNKRKVIQVAATDPLIAEYQVALRKLLASRDCLAISGTGPDPLQSPWPVAMLGLLGCRTDEVRFVPLVEKDGVATCAALLSRGRSRRAGIVCMRGSNNLPGAAGIARLTRAFNGEDGPRHEIP